MAQGTDPRAAERVGTVLNDKWTLEELLGAGGMGAVYAGRHRNGARAAVKVLHPELARIPDVRERFLREGYAANRVEHRGAVQVLDDDIVKTGPDEGSAYLVMELLEGESLQDRANRSPKLGEAELLDVMDAVLDVLGAAHEHGVVHRDLKPENIFLARDPEREGVRVKVLDFGLARISEASSVTHAGIAVGTPSFMSPEQAAGRGDEIDGRTDIFALGATVFRLVTGRRIHNVDNMVQLVALMATVPAPPFRSVAPNSSEGFARIIDRALAFDKADRYPNAAAMRADIHALAFAGLRSSKENLLVIPFSVRRGSSPDSGNDVTVPTVRGKADTNAAVSDASDPAEASPRVRAPQRPAAPSATLPWALVLVLLAIGVWKLGPSLQDELVRRASLEPVVRKLWTSTSASATPPEQVEAPSVESSTDAGEQPDAEAAAVAIDVEDAGLASDDAIDGGDVSEDAVHDAGAPKVAKPRPLVKAPVKKASPPAPWTWKKTTPHPPPKHR